MYEDMQPNDMEIYKSQIEDEFFESVRKGENLYMYMYVPPYFLSDKVREYLDGFLIEEAYRNLFILKNKDTVYDDGYKVTVLLDDDSFKKEFFSKMLAYYTSKEDFIKCSQIKKEYSQYV